MWYYVINCGAHPTIFPPFTAIIHHSSHIHQINIAKYTHCGLSRHCGLIQPYSLHSLLLSTILLTYTKLTLQKILYNTKIRRTKWNSNPWTFGSYESYITPEGNRKGLHSREIFRQPLLNSRKFTVSKTIYWFMLQAY